MKKLKLVGIIAFVAVIGFAFFACDLPDPLDGTEWKTFFTLENGSIQISAVLRFSSPRFALQVDSNASVGGSTSGTYTVSGSTVTLTRDEGGDPITGTISGNKLTLSTYPDQSFTKQ